MVAVGTVSSLVVLIHARGQQAAESGVPTAGAALYYTRLVPAPVVR